MYKALAIAVALTFTASGVSAAQYVRGYVTKRGTYVSPHFRSSPNNSRFDNYSYQGNTNPYTGSSGYRSFFSYNRYGHGYGQH